MPLVPRQATYGRTQQHTAITSRMISPEPPQELLEAHVNLVKKDNGSSTSLCTTADTVVSDITHTSGSAGSTPPSSPEVSDADFEAKHYYTGLPSKPVLVYRTGTPWKRPAGPETYCAPKELRPVLGHPISGVWDELGPQVSDYLDSVNITWSTIDVVCFAEVEKDPGPPVLWIGVKPESLSREDAEVAAVGCEKLLKTFEIADVEIAFRESNFVRLACPKLLDYASSGDATATVRGPFTPAIGLKIAARDTPYAEGTGGIYISGGHCEGSEKLYVLTARHVVLPPDSTSNDLYVCTDHARDKIILLSPMVFRGVLESTTEKIRMYEDNVIESYKRKIESLKEKEDQKVVENRRELEDCLTATNASLGALQKFRDEVETNWSEGIQRVIGRIAYSPPIAVTGTKNYTEDWALVELDRQKFNYDNFRGNVVDLGTDISATNFKSMMNDPSFEYPGDRLLPLRGVIQEDELKSPKMRDRNGGACLIVIKGGRTSGVTVGRATGIKSVVREHLPGIRRTSMEWVILPYDKKSGPFSTSGDSGAIIVGHKGRIGGLLTSGAGQTDSTDTTYATPFYWIMERIQTQFPNAHIYQHTAPESPIRKVETSR